MFSISQVLTGVKGKGLGPERLIDDGHKNESHAPVSYPASTPCFPLAGVFFGVRPSRRSALTT